MAHTVQQVVSAAIQRSDLNNANLIPPAQVLTYLSQFQRRAYVKAARINPEYFGTDAVSATRAAYTDTWNIGSSPGNIAALTEVYVETISGTMTNVAVGDKVKLVDRRWPDIEIAPRVTVRGRIIKDYDDELSEAADKYVTVLRLYYSPLPAQLATYTQTVSIPDEWIDLLILPLARLMAVRDGRFEEAKEIKEELDDVLGDFEQAMLVYDHGVQRPLPAAPALPIIASAER